VVGRHNNNVAFSDTLTATGTKARSQKKSTTKQRRHQTNYLFKMAMYTVSNVLTTCAPKLTISSEISECVYCPPRVKITEREEWMLRSVSYLTNNVIPRKDMLALSCLKVAEDYGADLFLSFRI
jgi:hypothetical protein